MSKDTHEKKGIAIQEKPDANFIEKEIEALIDREKTKRRIVSKLLSHIDLKNRKSSF